MRIGALTFALVLLTAGVGCSDDRCPPVACPLSYALSLHLRDAADGGPVLGGAVNGVPCPSMDVCIATRSDGGFFSVGPASVDVTAPGYQPSHLDVDVPAATERCSCVPFVPQTRDVPLIHL